MRRKDREVADAGEMRAVIRECRCCRLAFADGKSAYIVPLNFGYDEGKNVFYFHGAGEGKKMELARKNGYAGFEMDTAHEMVTGEKACSFSFLYRSVVGEGRITVIEDLEEKRAGLDCIMKQMSGRDGWEYPEVMLKKTGVLRLDVEKMTAKEHQ